MKNYSLVVRNVKNLGKFHNLSDALEEFDLYRYVFDTGAYYSKEHEAVFCSWEQQEWTAYEGHMIILSEKFPQMVFELTCQENDVFWKEYFKDGKTETCYGEVIFESPKTIEWDSLLAF